MPPLADIGLVLDDIEQGKAVLLIPATAYEEIRYSRLNDAQKSQFDGFCERSNVILVDVTPPIAATSARIRQLSDLNSLVTKQNDSLIVATAITMNASVFHTLDGGLLRLNKHDIVSGLRIVKPVPLSHHRGLDM